MFIRFCPEQKINSSIMVIIIMLNKYNFIHSVMCQKTLPNKCLEKRIKGNVTLIFTLFFKKTPGTIL